MDSCCSIVLFQAITKFKIQIIFYEKVVFPLAFNDALNDLII